MRTHSRRKSLHTSNKVRLGILVLLTFTMISGIFAQEPSATPTTVTPSPTTIIVPETPVVTETSIAPQTPAVTETADATATENFDETLTPASSEELASATPTETPTTEPTVEAIEEAPLSEGFNSEALGTFPIMPLSAQAYCQMEITDGGDNDPYTYTFNVTSENVTAFAWNLGDGTTSTNQTINHTYGTAQDYTVTLDCTPAPGFGTSLPQTTGYVQIMLPPPVAFFTIPEGYAFIQSVDALNGLTFTTNNMSSPTNDPNLTYTWSISGPSVTCSTAVSATNQSCEITDYGTYTINLTATSGALSSMASRTIQVTPPPPVVDFTVAPGYAITTGGIGNFTAGMLPDSGPVTTWEWYFNGSATPSYTGQNINHTFTSDGSYSVRLVATGPGGAHEITRTVSVYAAGQEVQAAFNMTQNGAGATPGSVNVCFENTSTGDISIYEWDFGDNGTIDSNESARYFCADFPAGFLGVRLNVTSADGTVTSDAYRESILVARPEAVIGGGPASGTQSTDFNFTGNQSTGLIDTYFWDFGNGVTSNNQNPGNIRLPIGNHRISLTVTGPGGSHTVYRDVTVTRQEISCAISGEFAPLPGSLNQTYSAVVNNDLGRTITYQWSVSNVTPAPTPNNQATYSVAFPGEGTYQVNLNAYTDDGSVCSDTKTVNVAYPPLVCDINHNLPSPIFPNGLTYDYQGVVTGTGGRAMTYEWFIDGAPLASTTNISQLNPLSATNAPAPYTLRYVATASDGNSCFEEIVVTPQPYPTLTCADVTIQGAGSPNPFTANHNYTASYNLVGGRTLGSVSWTVENGTPATSTSNPIAVTWDPAFSTTNGSTTNTLGATLTINTPGQGAQVISCDREIAVTAPALSCGIQGDFTVVQGDLETYTANISNLNGRTPTIAWQLVKNSDNSVISLPANTGTTFDISFLDALGIDAGAYTLSYSVAVTNPTDSCNPSTTITVATEDQNFICEGFTAYPTTVTHWGNATYGFEIDNPRNIDLEYDIVLVGPNVEERILYTDTTTVDGNITRAFALSDFAHATYGLLGIYQIRVDVRAVDNVATPYVCSMPVNGNITVGTVAPSISFVDTNGDPIPNPSLIEYGQEICVVNSSVENGSGQPDASYEIRVNGNPLATNCFIPTIGNHNVQLVGTSDFPNDNRQWPANGNLSVYGTPSINITRQPVQYAGIPMQFNGNGENITGYQWVFYNIDDINNPQQVGTASGQTPTQTFGTPGRYRAVLTGQNPLRNVEQYLDFTLHGTNDLAASFVPSQYAGVAPMEVCFRDTSVGNGITSWTWEFLDPITGAEVLPTIINNTNASPCVTFPDPDTRYRVRLTVENATTSTSANNIIRTYSMEESQVTFRIEPQGGNLYCFTPVASGNFTVTGWDLGDGMIVQPTGTDGSVCRNYLAAGDYQVKMQFETPTNPNNEVERPFTVGPNGAPALTANAVCAANRVATFTITNTGASMTIADQATVTGINGVVDVRPIQLASGASVNFDVANQSDLLTLTLTDNISVTADTTCNYPPELTVRSVCVSGVPSFIVENARPTDGPMATPQNFTVRDNQNNVIHSGTIQLTSGQASQTINLPVGTDPYETYVFESNGSSANLSATHTCSAAQIQVSSVCGTTTGLPVYTITNNDSIDMATAQPYTVIDGNGITVASGSFQLTSGASQDIILTGMPPYETYTFVSVSAFGNFNVDHTCTAPQVTVTPTCDPATGLPVFVVNNPSTTSDMLVTQEYIIRDSSGAEVTRSTFQLDAGESTNVTLPAGTTPYGTYTFESTGVSGTFNIDHSCGAPQVNVTSICEGGLPVFVVTNPDPSKDMATSQEYVIRDSSGTEVARSTFQIPANGTARVTLPAGTTPYGTYTFESTGTSGTFNVTHTCDAPQITVTSVCEAGLPVFVVTNATPANGMATAQEYVVRDSNGAQVLRSTFQLFSGDATQRISLPAGTPAGQIYTFESNGSEGNFTVATNCELPADPTTGKACAGNDVHFVLTNSGAAVQDIPYTISNGSDVVASGTVSISAGGRSTVTLPASLNKGGNYTLTFGQPVPNVTVTVQSPCGFVIEPICGNPARFVIDNVNGFEGTVTYTLTANGVDITPANNTVTFVAGGRVVISVPRGYRNNVQLTLNTPTPTISTINCGVVGTGTVGTPTTDATPAPFRFTGLSFVASAPVCAHGCPVYQLYHTDETGNWGIFRLDSSDPLNRVHVRENLSLGDGEGVIDLSPSLSPDNNWIVFQSNRDGNWELYVAPTSGGNPDAVQRLTYNSIAIDANPMWGPNNFVVFETTRHGNYDLYLIDMSTGEEYRLTDDEGDDINAYWSPDGTRVVFQSNRNNPDQWQLFELNIANGALRLLSEETGTTNDALPQYSRDGSKIVFSNYANAGDNGVLMIMDANGNNRQVISDVNGDATNPAWSPSDSYIAYQSTVGGDLNIYVYEVATGATRQLTDNGIPNYAPTWQCSDDRVIFTSDIIDGTPNIFEANASPISDPAILVDVDADQKTFGEFNDIYPESSPAKEHASREGQTSMGSFSEQTTFLFPPANLTPIDLSFDGLQRDMWEPINTCS